MISSDYHIHTLFSPDSSENIEDIIKTAISLNFKEIAITDHVDFLYPGLEFQHDIDIAKYVSIIEELAQLYKDKIKVRLGLELGLRPDVKDKSTDITLAHNFDFIIGSTHDYFGQDWYYPEVYKTKSKKEIYNLYFEHMLDIVNTCDCFDVLGHIDYIERYARYEDKTLRYSDYADIIDTILQKAIQKGKGIEINSSGYAYGLNHPHPQKEIIQKYVELGGEIITIGSDSHTKARIGANFDIIYDMIQSIGIKYLANFEKRKPIFYKI